MYNKLYNLLVEGSRGMMKARRSYPNNQHIWKKVIQKEKFRAKRAGISHKEFITQGEAKFMKHRGPHDENHPKTVTKMKSKLNSKFE